MPTISTIETDGARLHAERRGDGSPLLLIPGGTGISANFSAVADALAWDYTVLAYDRRGHGRSRLLPGVSGTLSLAQQSADARAVIEHSGYRSTAMLGSSAGAVIGLDLAARFPGTVRILIAHEPPLIGLLPEAARLRAGLDEVQRILKRDGPHAAVIRLMRLRGIWPGSRLQRAALQLGRFQRTGFAADMAFFVTNEIQSFHSYEPDLGTSTPAGCR